jgi:hypothetical protein
VDKKQWLKGTLFVAPYYLQCLFPMSIIKS